MMATLARQPASKRRLTGSGASRKAKRRPQLGSWTATLSLIVAIVLPVVVAWFAITSWTDKQGTTPSYLVEPDWTLYAFFGAGIIASLALGLKGIMWYVRRVGPYRETGSSGARLLGALTMFSAMLAFFFVLLANLVAVGVFLWAVPLP